MWIYDCNENLVNLEHVSRIYIGYESSSRPSSQVVWVEVLGNLRFIIEKGTLEECKAMISKLVGILNPKIMTDKLEESASRSSVGRIGHSENLTVSERAEGSTT